MRDREYSGNRFAKNWSRRSSASFSVTINSIGFESFNVSEVDQSKSMSKSKSQNRKQSGDEQISRLRVRFQTNVAREPLSHDLFCTWHKTRHHHRFHHRQS